MGIKLGRMADFIPEGAEIENETPVLPKTRADFIPGTPEEEVKVADEEPKPAEEAKRFEATPEPEKEEAAKPETKEYALHDLQALDDKRIVEIMNERGLAPNKPKKGYTKKDAKRDNILAIIGAQKDELPEVI